MDRPFARFATRAAYVARQLPRFAWFVGHSFTMDRLAARAWDELGESSRPRPRTRAPIPDRGRLYQDLAALFRQDLANVEAGIYPLPEDHDGSLMTWLERSRLFFRDLPEVLARRKRNATREVRN